MFALLYIMDIVLRILIMVAEFVHGGLNFLYGVVIIATSDILLYEGLFLPGNHDWEWLRPQVDALVSAIMVMIMQSVA